MATRTQFDVIMNAQTVDEIKVGTHASIAQDGITVAGYAICNTICFRYEDGKLDWMRLDDFKAAVKAHV